MMQMQMASVTMLTLVGMMHSTMLMQMAFAMVWTATVTVFLI
jgi:hypothetical protein